MAETYGQGAGILFFDEDFDAPPAPAVPSEPEFVAPVFTESDIAAAREDAAREAREATLAEAKASIEADAARALAAIADALAKAHGEAADIAEQAAEAVTRLLLDCFAAAFPALGARHGPREAAAVAHAILPSLRREPAISVRVNPHAAEAMRAEIDALDPELAGRVRLVPTDAVATGDIRIVWEDGSAIRDTAALWKQIETVLAPAGLLKAKQTVEEPALVD